MADTFTRTGNLSTDNAAFGRTADSIGTAGVTGPVDYSGVLGARTLDAPVQQPATPLEAGQKYTQVMAKQAEVFEPFIQKITISHPRWWHDRIPRGEYKLFNGARKETNVFRGGLVHYAGLAHWGDVVDYSISGTGTDATGSINGQEYPNTHPDPVTYGYSWENLQWGGKNMSWASDPIHQDMFRFTQDARKQLSWILQQGIEFGLSQQEVWNRDNYIFAAVNNARAFIMTSGGESASAEEQFYYNPYSYGTAAEVEAKTKMSTVPFMLLPVTSEVQPLNFDVLDFINDELTIRAPQSGIGSEGGRPVFGLPVSTRDFEKMIKGSKDYREDWRQAMPMALVKDYGMLLKTFRYYAIIEDMAQLRFKIKSITTAADANTAGISTFGTSATTKLFLAEYVAPRKLGRTGVNGIGIPEASMDYIKAELAISPLFMNNVFTNQFLPDTPQLGSGTTFLPRKGLNGTWGFLNILDKTTNPFGKTGNFYGTYEIVPRPDDNFVDTTAIVYRRCNETLQARYPINIDEDTGDTASIVSTGVETAATGEAILNTVITVKCNNALDVGPGTPVEINALGKGGLDGTIFGMVVVTRNAPEYGIAIDDLNGVEGSGTAVTDFTAANFPAGYAVTVS
jgi:hypothetical protein